MKSAAALLAVGVLAAGCVSIPSLTPTPVATATAAPTTTPVPATPRPTATPTKIATLAPTQAPATTPPTGATPSPSPSPTGALAYSTRDLLLDDPMTTNNGWRTGPNSGGDVSFGSGSLQLAPTDSGWLWSSRPTGSQSGTLAVRGSLTPTGQGVFGMLCDSGDQTLFGGLLDTAGQWLVVQIDSSGISVLASGPLAAADVAVGKNHDIWVECAGVKTGRLRVELWLSGSGMLGAYQQPSGPSSFDRIATYGESSGAGFGVALARAVAFGVADLNGEPSSAAQDLMLKHIPQSWVGNCFEGPVPGPYGGLAQARVACYLGDAGHPGADMAEYEQYDNTADMNAAYQARVATFPPGTADSCQNGSRETPYHYTGATVDAGRLLCTDQAVGIRFDWTENTLDILTTLIDFDGSYGDTFSDWTNAGPN